MTLNVEQVVLLPDGRSLGYAECGDPAGAPVLYFHGAPSSRLDVMTPEFDAIASSVGVRLVAIDRPGMGLSDPKPDRTILDWPVDVVGFAEASGLGRFSVLGAAGGAPYAIACAVRIPHRLRSVGVVSGVAPMEVAEATDWAKPQHWLLFTLARRLPWLARRAMTRMARDLMSGSERLLENAMRSLPAADREILGRPATRANFLASLRSAFRRGEEGPFRDVVLVSRPWGFDLGKVPMIVNLWFGGQDVTVPPAAGRYLAGALGRSEARFYPTDGHLSLLHNRLGDVLTGLLATAMREAGKPV